MPRPWSIPAFIELLDRLGVDALLPLASWLFRALVPVRDEIDRHAALNIPDPAAFAAADDGWQTLRLCAELGIPAPRLMARESVVLPAVVKPRVDVGGAVGVTFCRHEAELEAALDYSRQFGSPVIQEYIPGGAEQMRTIVLLFDRDGCPVAHFTTRKLWTHPLEGGITTLSVSTDDRDLVRQVLPFFLKVGWRGPAEVELKLDPRDGLVKVIEINPRFPGYVGFATRCGLPLTQLAIRAALGQPVMSGGYAIGRMYLNPGLHLKAVAQRVVRGPERVKELLRAGREVWDAPWLSMRDLTDPAPRLGKIPAELRAVAQGRPHRSEEPDGLSHGHQLAFRPRAPSPPLQACPGPPPRRPSRTAARIRRRSGSKRSGAHARCRVARARPPAPDLPSAW